jgi:GNAT superfamily N-acetyltransferase
MLLPNYTIHRINQTDEPFLWEMLYQAIYVPQGQPPFPKDIVREPEIAKYVDRWGNDDDQGYVVVDNSTGRPVGAVWIRRFTKGNKGYGYINDNIPELSIAVLPEYRNEGLGTELLDILIKDAEGKYPALSLSVSVDNPAVRLYQRFGFEIVDQQGASVTMKKVLRKINQPVT